MPLRSAAWSHLELPEKELLLLMPFRLVTWSHLELPEAGVLLLQAGTVT